MDEYKRLQRSKIRGEHCMTSYGICGCGSRTKPSKKHKKRMIRRRLKNELRQQ